MKQILSVATALVLLVGAFAIIQPTTITTADAKSINCGDLKTLVLKFNKPVHDFNVNVCPSGGGGPGTPGPPGPAGANGANGLNGRDGMNGLNGTTLPADVIEKVNTLAAKAGVLDQIVAAYQNGSLGNGGVSIGCIEFPNGTAIGDCPPAPPANETGTNETGGGGGVIPPVINETGGGNQTGNVTGNNTTPLPPIENGTVIPPVDNGTVIPPVENGSVVVPPVDNGTVVVPPIDNGSVIVPPSNGTVVVNETGSGDGGGFTPNGTSTNTTTETNTTSVDNGNTTTTNSTSETNPVANFMTALGNLFQH